MSDYSAWPIWTGGVLDGEPDLSSELTADIAAWDELFQEHFHWDDGWRSASAEADYAHAAPELVRRLAWELGDAFVVRLDLWPVADPELLEWVKARTGGSVY